MNYLKIKREYITFTKNIKNLKNSEILKIFFQRKEPV